MFVPPPRIEGLPHADGLPEARVKSAQVDNMRLVLYRLGSGVGGLLQRHLALPVPTHTLQGAVSLVTASREKPSPPAPTQRPVLIQVCNIMICGEGRPVDDPVARRPAVPLKELRQRGGGLATDQALTVPTAPLSSGCPSAR
jgi:hypothetical protein